MYKWDDPRISRIIKLEFKITEALIKGHKAAANDQFQSDREELKRLREEVGLVRKKVEHLKDH